MSEKPQKFSIEEIKKVPPDLLLQLINRAKRKLKDNDTMQRVFQEREVPIEILDLIPMCFGDLDVSARTEHGVITFNYKLLCDGDFDKDLGYVVHEVTHALDQCFGEKPTRSADDGEYLENPSEIAGFQNQVEFMADEFGKDEAEDYVDHLLEHHDYDGKDAHRKKQELMEEVSS
jgi:hypothetical protein